MRLWTITVAILFGLISFSLLSAVIATDLEFTKAEQQYLEQLKSLRICTDPDWMPYEGINDKDEYTGIMSDFHKLWAGVLGKPVELVKASNWQEALSFFEEKHCDILSSAHSLTSRQYLAVTQPIIRYPFALATQPEQTTIENLTNLDSNKPLVMVEGYAVEELVRQQYPDLVVTLVNDAETGLRMVEKGQAFAYIDTVPSINYQLLKHGIAHVKINTILDEGYSTSVGIHSELPELLEIYNKLITKMSDIEHQQILQKWMFAEQEKTLETSWIWQALLFLSLLIILFLVHYFYTVNGHNRHLRQINRELADISLRDQLTGMHNRYYFHQAFRLEVEKYQSTCSILMLDIDHFKSINDNYGHIIGDDVIKQVAALLHENIRQRDVVARWGGEEFLMLCPETSLEGAKKLAEELRKIIDEHVFAGNIEVTASFGVTAYRHGEPLEECIERVDYALYKAKHSGRNRTVLG